MYICISMYIYIYNIYNGDDSVPVLNLLVSDRQPPNSEVAHARAEKHRLMYDRFNTLTTSMSDS